MKIGLNNFYIPGLFLISLFLIFRVFANLGKHTYVYMENILMTIFCIAYCNKFIFWGNLDNRGPISNLISLRLVIPH